MPRSSSEHCWVLAKKSSMSYLYLNSVADTGAATTAAAATATTPFSICHLKLAPKMPEISRENQPCQNMDAPVFCHVKARNQPQKSASNRQSVTHTHARTHTRTHTTTQRYTHLYIQGWCFVKKLDAQKLSGLQQY